MMAKLLKDASLGKYIHMTNHEMERAGLIINNIAKHVARFTHDKKVHLVLAAANKECSRVSSTCPFLRSSWSLPAFENKRSTPADDAGRPKICAAILARLGKPAGRPLAGSAGLL